MTRDKKLLSPRSMGKLYFDLTLRYYAKGLPLTKATRKAAALIRLIECE